MPSKEKSIDTQLSLQLCDFRKCLVHKAKLESYTKRATEFEGSRKRSHSSCSTDSNAENSSVEDFKRHKTIELSSDEETEINYKEKKKSKVNTRKISYDDDSDISVYVPNSDNSESEISEYVNNSDNEYESPAKNKQVRKKLLKVEKELIALRKKYHKLETLLKEILLELRSEVNVDKG